jgi:hypothetical protein
VNKTKVFSSVILFLIITTLFLGVITIQSSPNSNKALIIKNEEQFTDDIIFPKSANDDISYEKIFQNASVIRRGFESINFTVNVSNIQYAENTSIEINFPNSTIYQFEMDYVETSNKNFTYTYTPQEDAPLGFHEVRFLVYNESMDQLNTGNTCTNFTVTSDTWVLFNGSEILKEFVRGENVRADVIFLDKSGITDWTISVVNSTTTFQQKKIVELSENPEYITFLINESFDQINHIYYIAINITRDGGNTWNADYWGFLVKNINPTINKIEYEPSSVFRGELCVVELNVTDFESDSNELSVEMEITDPNGALVSINNPELNNFQGDLFKGNFTISPSLPKGSYDVEFIVEDSDNGITRVDSEITIKNNPPEIDGYEINDIDTDERISVAYGDNLEFDFDVSDLEGISYITVKLVLEEDVLEEDLFEEEDEYEVSVEYEDDPELTIRTEDLGAGTWTVYVSVTDTDGATTDLDDDFDTGPQQITIIPDLLSSVLPWVMLVVGVIIGLTVGIGLALIMKRRYKSTEEKTPEKKEIPPDKKTKDRKPPEKPKKIVKKEKEQFEETKPKKPPAKRKIKRKL